MKPPPTPLTMQLIDAAPIIATLEQIQHELSRLAHAESVAASAAAEPGWLPAPKLARHFGMARRTVDDYLYSGLRAGRVRSIHPSLPGGRQGLPLYHVGDFRTWLDTPKQSRLPLTQ